MNRTKAKILYKPAPDYDEGARVQGVQGTVILRAVFSADGKVKGIQEVGTPDLRLTAQAIRAARQIRFLPALLDGRPVSQFVKLEYSFAIM